MSIILNSNTKKRQTEQMQFAITTNKYCCNVYRKCSAYPMLKGMLKLAP